jgi:hypothetical protein
MPAHCFLWEMALIVLSSQSWAAHPHLALLQMFWPFIVGGHAGPHLCQLMQILPDSKDGTDEMAMQLASLCPHEAHPCKPCCIHWWWATSTGST